MIHTEKYAVRWHDTDAARAMTPSGVLTLMQETSNLQFERHARSLDRIRDEDGVGFILSRIAVDLIAPVRAYEQVEVETFTVESRGYTYRRGHCMTRGGAPVARAMSHWALVRVADRALVPVRDFPLTFGDEPEEETEMPLRFHIPKEACFETVGKRHITYADLDYNLHMNNTKYPNMLYDFLPDPLHTELRGFSLYYCHEAAYGDTLTVERAPGENGIYYFRAKQGDTLCLEAMVKVGERP